MTSPSQQPEWTCERFWELREAYLANRCEANALANLQKLAEIEPDLVPENAWIDCKDLLLLLLEDIPIATLLTSQQILFISTLNSSPPHVVATLAGHFLKRRNETTALLGSDAVAVAIAFARRIDDLNTCDVIADLLGPVLQNELIAKELMNQLDNSSNTEHRFRIYQVVISSLKSDKTTVVETTKTILTRAINELEGDDVLQQLSVMDLFANVAIVSAVAAQFVGEVGLTQRVYDLMQKCKDEPDGGFLYPACIKFFGSLSYCYPEAITAYPAFLPAVIDQISMFDRLDASTRLLAFDTFAHIAHKQEAKTKIQGILGTEGLKQTLSHFGAACASGPVDLRTRHIDALAVMFEHGEETQLSNWFKELGDGFPHFSAVSVSKPFKDLKIALLRLFHAVLSREFGKQTYIPMAEFSEWLLNKKSEPDWECAQLKEDLIKKLIDSPSAFISPEFRQKLRDYFGPAEAQLNVAWM